MNAKQILQAGLAASRKRNPDHRPIEAVEVYKYVGYSYPTSPNAEELGFYKSGCYSVHVIDANGDKLVAGYASKHEAVEHAKALPGVWWPQFIRWHGDWIE